MNPGSVFFDEEFAFHDGESGEKLFVVLGTVDGVSVIVKTTSQQHGRGTVFGCQPKDRFHNFYLPPKSTYLKLSTWVCLNEFYEIDAKKALQKKFDGKIKPVCDLVPAFIRDLQDCALTSEDISTKHAAIVRACLVKVS
ncbi:hypothetical protein [Mesorhizobium sp. M7A.F.Ca.US.008.03.1.1]|uniref:hypothetical protein n=1 Tax=Mesorhizobium sp. M7A.F.Ca.US.008.03.1.1 TaxID=2496742 RepID=UPI000FCB601D|nr:hypothetical protein [Mesorhizobium sp. M7A.F.Ca.US.008.03.1.1]RUW60179.1 hypothetical protein EOA16_19015 [Mesorhizobium sp. M7A.F.Ca.US.008.03.1.1]